MLFLFNWSLGLLFCGHPRVDPKASLLGR